MPNILTETPDTQNRIASMLSSPLEVTPQNGLPYWCDASRYSLVVTLIVFVMLDIFQFVVSLSWDRLFKIKIKIKIKMFNCGLHNMK
jgi:hypothetical protein